VHEQDCIDCEEGQTKLLDRIDRELEFRGNLTPEQKQKLLEIAEKCPVHRTLSSPITIVSKLAG
jgi:putative redox protein